MIQYPMISNIIVFKVQYNQNFHHCIMFYYLNIDIINELSSNIYFRHKAHKGIRNRNNS